MNSPISRARIFGDGGIAILELAFVVPIMLLVFIGAVDFALRLKHKQDLLRFSRVAASRLFNECWRPIELLEGDPVNSKAGWQKCVTQVSEKIKLVGSNALPSLELNTAIWAFRASSNPELGQYFRANHHSFNGNQGWSRVVLFAEHQTDGGRQIPAGSELSSKAEFLDLITIKNFLFAVKVEAPYEPVMPILQEIFNYEEDISATAII